MVKIFFKFIVVISVFIAGTHAVCPVTEDPQAIIDCLKYLTTGLYGMATQNVKETCKVASNIAQCASAEMGDCVGAQIGKATLLEIKSLAENCCPDKDNDKCPIRNGILSQQRCFAADSLVTLTNGQQKSITDLQSGDMVLAFDDRTKQTISTQILTLLDNQPDRYAIFKQLTTTSGRQLSLTASHLLPTNIHGYLMAKNIREGMTIYIINDDGFLTIDNISNVVDVVKQGYVAPLTQEGTLMVNRVAASCYATIDSHYLAHAALAPMRWWYGLFGEAKETEKLMGVHWFPKTLYELTKFLLPSIIEK